MARRPVRPTRERQARGRSRVGERFTAVVGPVAHGGHFIVRLPEPESRVVFTRHALPGEEVVVEITEGTEGDRFWRGDVVQVLTASPDRVSPPCKYAGPGLCGGCDFQHVALTAQRELKASVVREQLVRLGGFAADDPLVTGLSVQAVPGDSDGLGWRTRVEFATTRDGQRGMRRHRSHDVIPVDRCLIAADDARDVSSADSAETVVETVDDHSFGLAATGFWQVHPGAPTTLVRTVLEMLAPRVGESAMDLYAGVGLFARFLGEAVGPTGSLLVVESDRQACEYAADNLAGLPSTTVECGPVERVLAVLDSPPTDLVVLDPPREGARRKVVEQIVSSAPRAVAYVACDPAALARDLKIFAEHGYRTTEVRAFDLFPMTHHVECVARLER
jgi:tRNA/tmRNA/rRNA uracil-C5-methylase (TrmA/RlmC/RlmD family)